MKGTILALRIPDRCQHRQAAKRAATASEGCSEAAELGQLGRLRARNTCDEARRIAANLAKLPELLASKGQNMKRFAAMMGASALIAVMLSTPMARKAFSDAHTEDVKHLISVNNINPTGVQIILAMGDGSQLILEMDSITARSMAAQIRNLEMEPRGAP
jgi:hypothetical protein